MQDRQPERTTIEIDFVSLLDGQPTPAMVRGQCAGEDERFCYIAGRKPVSSAPHDDAALRRP